MFKRDVATPVGDLSINVRLLRQTESVRCKRDHFLKDVVLKLLKRSRRASRAGVKELLDIDSVLNVTKDGVNSGELRFLRLQGKVVSQVNRDDTLWIVTHKEFLSFQNWVLHNNSVNFASLYRHGKRVIPTSPGALSLELLQVFVDRCDENIPRDLSNESKLDESILKPSDKSMTDEEGSMKDDDTEVDYRLNRNDNEDENKNDENEARRNEDEQSSTPVVYADIKVREGSPEGLHEQIGDEAKNDDNNSNNSGDDDNDDDAEKITNNDGEDEVVDSYNGDKQDDDADEVPKESPTRVGSVYHNRRHEDLGTPSTGFLHLPVPATDPRLPTAVPDGQYGDEMNFESSVCLSVEIVNGDDKDENENEDKDGNTTPLITTPLTATSLEGSVRSTAASIEQINFHEFVDDGPAESVTMTPQIDTYMPNDDLEYNENDVYLQRTLKKLPPVTTHLDVEKSFEEEERDVLASYGIHEEHSTSIQSMRSLIDERKTDEEDGIDNQNKASGPWVQSEATSFESLDTNEAIIPTASASKKESTVASRVDDIKTGAYSPSLRPPTPRVSHALDLTDHIGSSSDEEEEDHEYGYRRRNNTAESSSGLQSHFVDNFKDLQRSDNTQMNGHSTSPRTIMLDLSNYGMHADDSAQDNDIPVASAVAVSALADGNGNDSNNGGTTIVNVNIENFNSVPYINNNDTAAVSTNDTTTDNPPVKRKSIAQIKQEEERAAEEVLEKREEQSHHDSHKNMLSRLKKRAQAKLKERLSKKKNEKNGGVEMLDVDTMVKNKMEEMAQQSASSNSNSTVTLPVSREGDNTGTSTLNEIQSAETALELQKLKEMEQKYIRLEEEKRTAENQLTKSREEKKQLEEEKKKQEEASIAMSKRLEEAQTIQSVLEARLGESRSMLQILSTKGVNMTTDESQEKDRVSAEIKGLEALLKNILLKSVQKNDEEELMVEKGKEKIQSQQESDADASDSPLFRENNTGVGSLLSASDEGEKKSVSPNNGSRRRRGNMINGALPGSSYAALGTSDLMDLAREMELESNLNSRGKSDPDLLGEDYGNDVKERINKDNKRKNKERELMTSAVSDAVNDSMYSPFELERQKARNNPEAQGYDTNYSTQTDTTTTPATIGSNAEANNKQLMVDSLSTPHQQSSDDTESNGAEEELLKQSVLSKVINQRRYDPRFLTIPEQLFRPFLRVYKGRGRKIFTDTSVAMGDNQTQWEICVWTIFNLYGRASLKDDAIVQLIPMRQIVKMLKDGQFPRHVITMLELNLTSMLSKKSKAVHNSSAKTLSTSGKGKGISSKDNSLMSSGKDKGGNYLNFAEFFDAVHVLVTICRDEEFGIGLSTGSGLGISLGIHGGVGRYYGNQKDLTKEKRGENWESSRQQVEDNFRKLCTTAGDTRDMFKHADRPYYDAKGCISGILLNISPYNMVFPVIKHVLAADVTAKAEERKEKNDFSYGDLSDTDDEDDEYILERAGVMSEVLEGEQLQAELSAVRSLWDRNVDTVKSIFNYYAKQSEMRPHLPDDIKVYNPNSNTSVLNESLRDGAQPKLNTNCSTYDGVLSLRDYYYSNEKDELNRSGKGKGLKSSLAQGANNEGKQGPGYVKIMSFEEVKGFLTDADVFPKHLDFLKLSRIFRACKTWEFQLCDDIGSTYDNEKGKKGDNNNRDDDEVYLSDLDPLGFCAGSGNMNLSIASFMEFLTRVAIGCHFYSDNVEIKDHVVHLLRVINESPMRAKCLHGTRKSATIKSFSVNV